MHRQPNGRIYALLNSSSTCVHRKSITSVDHHGHLTTVPTGDSWDCMEAWCGLEWGSHADANGERDAKWDCPRQVCARSPSLLRVNPLPPCSPYIL